MMKFFRKHNKTLLAVFMVLLMIVFLGGSALDSMLRPSGDQVVAESNLGPLSTLDHQVAENTTDILAAMGMNWKLPHPASIEPIDEIDWILLTREAKQLKMEASLATIRSSFGSQDVLDTRARQLRVRPDRILQAIAELSSIQQTASVIGRSAEPSEAVVKSLAYETLDKVEIEAVLLPALAFVDEDAEFTDEEIEAQFSAYQEREPGNGLEFGYYVPPAVNVQYFKIDRNQIAEQMQIANLDKKARAYFDENREREAVFRRPPEDSTAESADAADGSFEGPPEKPSPYLTWEEAKESAIDIVRKQKAGEAAERIGNWLGEHTGDPWFGVVRGKDGYKPAPENVATLEYYDSIRIPKKIAYSGAVTVGTTGFFNEEEADDVEGIGGAEYRLDRGQRHTLRTLAFRSQAIVADLSSESSANATDYLSTFQTCVYPLAEFDGNLFVWRVVDARKGHVPESVDEVRTRVTSDLRLLRGFAVARARAESLQSCMVSESLKEAFENDTELVSLRDGRPGTGLGFFEPPAFARTRGYYGGGGGDRKTSTLIGGGIGSVPREVAEACFALGDDEKKTAILELPGRATVMLASFVARQPAHADDFVDMRDGFVNQASAARSRTAISEWLNPDNIRARTGFKIVSN